ncbi:MAG TPA: hypothetical protein DIT97_04710 [Gimesia maris]|uniref:Uncharacterized protein n=1 Tax=Gimesia maris TaxID=122 RepID=A0A3D3R2S5_9PLAN|nr:hypothetical protein [Gimesia maris]
MNPLKRMVFTHTYGVSEIGGLRRFTSQFPLTKLHWNLCHATFDISDAPNYTGENNKPDLVIMKADDFFKLIATKNH